MKAVRNNKVIVSAQHDQKAKLIFIIPATLVSSIVEELSELFVSIGHLSLTVKD